MNKKIPKHYEIGTIYPSNKYGDVEIVGYKNPKSVQIRFIDTGYTYWAEGKNIKKGKLKDKLKPSVFGVGFQGDGKYLVSINRRNTPAYQAWADMLRRCYGTSYHASKYYFDVTVCDEWHNFQNFAEWFYSQDWEGKQLDKDIKVHGSRVYSPDTCLMVTSAENVSHATRLRLAS